MRVQDNQQYKAHIIWFSHTLDLPVDLWTSGPQLGTWPARAVDQWSPSETMEEFCPMIYTPTLRTTGPLDQWTNGPMGLSWGHGLLGQSTNGPQLPVDCCMKQSILYMDIVGDPTDRWLNKGVSSVHRCTHYNPSTNRRMQFFIMHYVKCTTHNLTDNSLKFHILHNEKKLRQRF